MQQHLSVSKLASPQGDVNTQQQANPQQQVAKHAHNKSRASTGTKKDKVHDTWQENIHFTHFHEDPEDA